VEERNLRNPSSANFLAWWDADPVRELLNGAQIDKYGTGGDTRLLTGSGVASSNGTKSTPVLSGDLFGDWREEVICATPATTPCASTPRPPPRPPNCTPWPTTPSTAPPWPGRRPPTTSRPTPATSSAPA
jgi:hypothetical protein